MEAEKGINVLIGIADENVEVEGVSRANSSGCDEKSMMIRRVGQRNQTHANSKHELERQIEAEGGQMLPHTS